jgi:hypothetical protein
MYGPGIEAIGSAKGNSGEKRLAKLLVDAREVGNETVDKVGRFGLR